MSRTTTPIAKFEPLPLALLHEHPDNPRKHFDETRLTELAQSIREQGLLQPLVVRPKDTGYQVIAGARRLRALRAINDCTLDRPATGEDSPAVPCIVREIDDVTALAVMVAENTQRADVHPLEEADGFSALLKFKGWDVERIAAHVGLSQSYVYQRLQLAKLTKAAREKFVAGVLTAAHAIELARLTEADQAAALEWLIHRGWEPGGKATPRVAPAGDLRTWIRGNLQLRLARAGFDKADAELVADAGSCVDCPKRSGNRPGLFADLTRDDICTDKACYATKATAALERAKREARKAKEQLISLSEQRWGGPGKSLSDKEWKKAKATESGALRGVMIDGPSRGRVVTFKPVGKEAQKKVRALQGKKPKAKPKATSKRRTDDWQARQRRDEAKRKRLLEQARAMSVATIRAMPDDSHTALWAVAELVLGPQTREQWRGRRLRPLLTELEAAELIPKGLAKAKAKDWSDTLAKLEAPMLRRLVLAFVCNAVIEEHSPAHTAQALKAIAAAVGIAGGADKAWTAAATTTPMSPASKAKGVKRKQPKRKTPRKKAKKKATQKRAKKGGKR